MKAFLAVHGTQGAASASVRETVDAPDRGRGARAAALAPGRRHLPHRGRAGPGRARPDARRPPRGRARLRAVPRAPRAGARQAGAAEAAPRAPTLHVHRRRPARAAGPGGAAGADRVRLRRPGRRRQGRADPGRDAAQPVRRRADRRGLQGRHPGRAHADREGPGYTCATARLLLHTIRKEVLGQRGGAGRDGRRATPTTSRSFIKKGVDAELLDEKLLQFDLARLGAALKAERDLQFDYLGLQTLYDRYFLHVRRRRASSCRRPSSCAWRWAWR